tara:strand:- start:946 stop:1806 length:861 start_codon:yes stop_codon:yes gene_type:complete
MSVAAILGGLTAGGLALSPWLMRTLPGLVARGSGPLARKKLLEKAGRAANPLHGGRLARGAKSGAYGLGTAYGVDALMGQEAAPTIEGSGTQTGAAARMPNAWNPREGLMTNKEFKRAQSETFWGNMNKMMQMSAILNATGGDTKGFQEMMNLANKKILSDAGDQRDIDTYDSVFVKGNMPNTAIEAYERMIASKASPEKAAAVAGQYVKMRDIRINKTEERDALLNRITLLFEGGNAPAAILAVKRGLAAGILPTNMFEDPMGNALTGEDLNKRIEEIFGGIVIE